MVIRTSSTTAATAILLLALSLSAIELGAVAGAPTGGNVAGGAVGDVSGTGMQHHSPAELQARLLRNAARYRSMLIRARDTLQAFSIADSDLHKLANLLTQAMSMKMRMRQQVNVLRKRACSVLDLGGHCDAEYGANLMDQINHMLKPGGPGR